MRTKSLLRCCIPLALAIVGGGFGLSGQDEPPPPIGFADAGRYGQATTFQIALGDLDGDGDLDAVFANQGGFDSRVLLNDGTGQFAYTDQRLTRQGHGVGIGDLDGDGDLDLFIACAYAFGRHMRSRVYFNDGNARFSDSGQDLGDTSISGNLVQPADVDADGDLDAFVAYLTVPGREFIGRVYLNDGAGAFAPSDYDFPFGTLFHDLDGDGDVDAFVKESGVGYRTLRNDGAGGFTEVWRLACEEAAYEPWNVAFGDLDGDGIADALDTNGTSTSSGPTVLLRGDGTGSFEPRNAGLPSTGVAWPVLRDFDGDGSLDVFLSLVDGENRLWLNDGTARFTDSGVRLPGPDSRGPGVGDLDGDGDVDLFVPAYGLIGGPNTVWLSTPR